MLVVSMAGLQNDNLVSLSIKVVPATCTPTLPNPCSIRSYIILHEGIRRSAMVEFLLNHGAEPLNLDPMKLFRLCAEQGVMPLVQQAVEVKQVNPATQLHTTQPLPSP